MMNQQSVSERWYDANDIGGRNAFFRDLIRSFARTTRGNRLEKTVVACGN
jgi:hypothetical protein